MTQRRMALCRLEMAPVVKILPVPTVALSPFPTAYLDTDGRPGQRSANRSGKMKKNLEDIWAAKPEKGDYAAAQGFLTLLFDEKKAAKLIQKLKKIRV